MPLDYPLRPGESLPSPAEIGGRALQYSGIGSGQSRRQAAAAKRSRRKSMPDLLLLRRRNHFSGSPTGGWWLGVGGSSAAPEEAEPNGSARVSDSGQATCLPTRWGGRISGWLGRWGGQTAIRRDLVEPQLLDQQGLGVGKEDEAQVSLATI
ncbi:unnamed protein product [Protopolystoma xenopodis]|uniref:Uncharacterized protein n=1 Tax=Protopolystoma xenopodis TaxID=117903 RepID=A0A448XNJ6_9PLAT|nr:unnamed protein product [Protopolystoma xenopodis]